MTNAMPKAHAALNARWIDSKLPRPLTQARRRGWIGLVVVHVNEFRLSSSASWRRVRGYGATDGLRCKIQYGTWGYLFVFRQ